MQELSAAGQASGEADYDKSEAGHARTQAALDPPEAAATVRPS